MKTRLTKKDIEYQLSHISCVYGGRIIGKAFFGLMCKEMLEYKAVEEKLGFGLQELVQMLINGIWEVGGVDSETKKPISKCIKHFRVCGIKNGKIIIIDDIAPIGYDININDNVLCGTLDLNKYKQKCLSGWALTKEELLNE